LLDVGEKRDSQLLFARDALSFDRLQDDFIHGSPA
jgi:hypothetical protein